MEVLWNRQCSKTAALWAKALRSRITIGKITIGAGLIGWIHPFSLLSLSSPPATPHLPPTIIEDRSGLEKDPSCFPDYRICKVRYPNGVRAYLVSDPALRSCSLSAAVGYGSFDDPPEHPGFAHLLEHVVFEGSTHYPHPGELLAFCTANGGQRNGITFGDRSLFGIQVDPPALQEAALRLSDLLACPLFLESVVEGEKQVVNEEFERNKGSDSWRRTLLLAQQGCPDSLLSRFDIGNCQTLAAITPHQLRSWHRQHFHTDRLIVVAMGNASLDQLQSAVTASFGSLPESTSKPPHLCRRSFLEEARHHLLHFPSVEQRRTLTLAWELDCGHSQDLEHQAAELLCRALMQNGPSGLIDELAQRGWIIDFSASVNRLAKAKSHLEIEVELTPQGSRQYLEVCAEIFRSLQTIKRSGLPKSVHTQLITAPLQAFRFFSPDDPFEHCLQTAFELCDEPLESYPRKSLAPMRHQPSDLVEVLEQLSAPFCIATLSWPEGTAPLPFDQIEPWMQTPWTAEKWDSTLIRQWETLESNPAYLLRPNPLIPDQIEAPVLPQPRRWAWPEAVCLEESDRAQAWHLPDLFYGRPDSFLEIRLRSPQLNGSPHSVAASEIVGILLEKRLLAISKMAEGAGARLRFQRTPLEWIFRVQGHPESTPEGLCLLLRSLKALSWSPEEWKEAQLLVQEQQMGLPLLSPDEKALRVFTALLRQPDPLFPEILKPLLSLNDVTFSQWWLDFFNRCYWRLLGYGPIDSQKMQDLCQRIHGLLGAHPWASSEHFHYSMDLPAEKSVVHRLPTAEGAGLVVGLVAPFDSMQERAALRVVQPWLDHHFFQFMRSDRQAAYVASVEQRDLQGKLGALLFQTLSHTSSPVQLCQWVREHIQTQSLELGSLFSPETFADYQQAALSLWKRAPSTMQGVFDFCTRTLFEEGRVDLAPRLFEQIEQLRYDECRAFLQKWLQSEDRTEMAILAGPSEELAESGAAEPSQNLPLSPRTVNPGAVAPVPPLE